jgi:hypothetical protein
LVGLHCQGVATVVTLRHPSPPFAMLCSVAINLDLFDLSNLVGSEINENLPQKISKYKVNIKKKIEFVLELDSNFNSVVTDFEFRRKWTVDML